MNNICVFNVNWLGDAVFSLPVFTALRKAYPQARITCVCVPRVAEVVKFSSDIDDVLIMDEKGAHFWPWQKLAFILHLRSLNFDTAFVLHPSLSRAMIVWMAGIKRRIGFCKWPKLMTEHVPNDPIGVHRMDHYLKVVEAAGIKVVDRTYHLQHLTDDVLVQGKYVVFNTGGNWDLKRWPRGMWVALASVFKSENARVVFTGSMHDFEDAQYVIDRSGVDGVNLCGKTSLGQSLSVYANANVVISADSGPLHLAQSVGAKVIGLFGPTRQEITGPRGTSPSRILFHDIGCNKTPCYHLSCLDNVCMKGIRVDDVVKAYKELV